MRDTKSHDTHTDGSTHKKGKETKENSYHTNHEDISLPKIYTTTKRKLWVKYEDVMWTLHILITTLAIIDRFTTNVWPRQMFRIGAGSAGTDRIVGFKPGPWSVVFYDVMLARISGRFSICCFNFMLISRLHILEQIIANSWLSRNLIDCSNIINANLQAHKWNGIALCILTLIHVWSILLPCITHGWAAKVIAGPMEWPLSERTPPGFKDADVDNETMSLQVDDVFRMVEMTLLLGIITPLSIRWMSNCWHLGIHVHRFVTVLYFVDIVRRHSHPHSWVLNTPIFVIWILDKMMSVAWRRQSSPEVKREMISDDYVLLLWKDSPHLLDATSSTAYSVGRRYQIKLDNSSCLESRHPFTAFSNRGSTQLFDHNLLMDTTSTPSDFEWTSGLVIKIFHGKRQKPRIGGVNEVYPHSKRLSREELSEHLSIWGPFQGSMNELITKSLFCPDSDLLTSSHSNTNIRSVVLAGSGSAINFIIDLLSLLASLIQNSSSKALSAEKEEDVFDDNVTNDIIMDKNEKTCVALKLRPILCLYTTRDPQLFKWAIDVVSRLMKKLDDDEHYDHLKEYKVILDSIRIVLAFTGSSDALNEPKEQKVPESNVPSCHTEFDSNDDDDEEEEEEAPSPLDVSLDATVLSTSSSDDDEFLDEENGVTTHQKGATNNIVMKTRRIEVTTERINFEQHISDHCDVFCQGSFGFLSVVKNACKTKKNIRIYTE